ncbi:MAG: hypothetical protein AB7U20_24065 [Planctomycetaceae bacterium]
MSTAHAAIPLSVAVDSSAVLSRSEGPIPLTLRLRWGGPGVFDGRLLLTVVDAHEGTLARVETDELYLSEGEQEYSLLLPAFAATGQLGELELRVTCLAGNERQPLPTVMLRVPTTEQRRLVVLVAGENSTQPPAVNRFVNALKLEPFNPLPDRGELTTVNQHLTPDRFPEDPLQLCPYDLLVIPPGELQQLKPRQLEAVASWARAGGSLVVFPEGTPKTPHLEFLQQIVADGGRPELTFVVDNSGKLVAPEVRWPVLLHVGIGRIVLATEDAMALAVRNDRDWRRAIAFLWKVQQAHWTGFVDAGRWDVDVAKEAANKHGIARGWNVGQVTDGDTLAAMASRIAPINISGGSGMLGRMLPAGLRLVPFGLMVVLLLLYVGAIGPFDYWFLGLLRQRKLTWVLFPAVTCGFTSFAVWISNAFMATADHRNSVVIRDIGHDGEILKESRFELLFPSRSTTMRTELRRALYMPLSHTDFIAADWQYNPYASYQREQLGRSGPPLMAGRPPQRTAVSQQIAQWTPQLNRSLTIPRPSDVEEDERPPVPAFDWAAPFHHASPAAVEQTARRVRRAFGQQAAAYVYQLDERRVLCGPEHFFADELHGGRQMLNEDGQWVWTQPDFLQDLCVRRQPGWFGVVSQTSPGCGRTAEDLALLDPSDRSMWLLVICVEEADETVVYRKVYRQEPHE